MKDESDAQVEKSSLLALGGEVEQRIWPLTLHRPDLFHDFDCADFHKWKREWNVNGMKYEMELNFEECVKWNNLAFKKHPAPLPGPG